MNRLRLAVGAATGALLVALAGCGKRADPWEGLPGPPRVMVTFPPLDCFVRNVAGDRAGLMCLCTTKGPHDYVFSIDECMKLKQADLFFSNGLGLDDHFADRMIGNSGNPRLRARKLGDELPESLRRKGENDHGHHHHAPGEEHHHHGIWDPHAWLGIPQAIDMVERIRDDLKVVDPQGAAIYDDNARIYIGKLKKLHEEGKKELAGLKTPVITFHEAMAYFADSYGLKVVGSINPEGGQETTSSRMKDLAIKCKDLEKLIITVEPQYPEGAAKTLREELIQKGVQVRIVELDPLETASKDELGPGFYEKKVRANIASLLGKKAQ